MNKGELIDRMAKKAGFRKADAAAALDAMLECIQEALEQGEKVTLVNFCTLHAAYRARRKGVNPSNNDPVMISEKVMVKFKAGKLLSDAVNNPNLLKELKTLKELKKA
jgi:DNA-binding protein HU-beta